MRSTYLEQLSSLQLVHYEWRDDCMYVQQERNMDESSFSRLMVKIISVTYPFLVQPWSLLKTQPGRFLSLLLARQTTIQTHIQ